MCTIKTIPVFYVVQTLKEDVIETCKISSSLVINLFPTSNSYLSIKKVEKSNSLSSFSTIAVDACPIFASNRAKIEHDQHVLNVENSPIIHIAFIECKQGKLDQLQ